MHYTLYNSGNTLTFKPNERIFTPHSKVPQKALDFYKDLVKFRNDPSVFICDEGGKKMEGKKSHLQILEF